MRAEATILLVTNNVTSMVVVCPRAFPRSQKDLFYTLPKGIITRTMGARLKRSCKFEICIVRDWVHEYTMAPAFLLFFHLFVCTFLLSSLLLHFSPRHSPLVPNVSFHYVNVTLLSSNDFQISLFSLIPSFKLLSLKMSV